MLKEETRDKLWHVYYDPKKDPVPYDVYGPLTENCMTLPPKLNV
jgi:hypothetical protein